MEIISLTELKYIHNRNDYLSRNANKINNLKKIYSYKTFFNKENQKEKLSVNNKKPNSVASKNSSYSNINEVKTPFNKLHSFNFRYIKQKIPLKFSLYSVLAMKKNNIYDKMEKIIQPENNKFNKTNNINIFKNINYIKTQSEMGKKNKNLLESKKDSMIYLSYLKNDFNESEKIRFYSMMKKLSTMKYILEIDPNNKYNIIKNVLLKEGIFDKKYFNEECFNNLIKFTQNKKSVINPSLNFKNNLIKIMNNKLNYTSENMQNNRNNSNYKKILKLKKLKNIINLNETLYRNKNTQFHSFDNFKINRFDLDLKNNLNRQTKMMKKVENEKFYNIKKDPEKILNSLGVVLNEEKNDIINNITNYQLKKNSDDNSDFGFNSDIDIFKKKHLLTEFACFIKAKDNFDLNQIKTKYNL